MEVNIKDLRFIILNESSLEHDSRNRVQKAELEAIVIMGVEGLEKAGDCDKDMDICIPKEHECQRNSF